MLHCLRSVLRASVRILAAAAACLSACDGSGYTVINRDDLASLGQAIPQGYCCLIPEGEATQPVGSIEVAATETTPGSSPRWPGSSARRLGIAIDEVTPPGVLEFTWSGPFIADAHLDDNPNREPMPFDPDVDVGGFRGTETLSFAATSCAFERVSFFLVVIEYVTLDPSRFDPESPFSSLGPHLILSRQRQRVEVVNCEPPPEPPPSEDLIAFARTMPEESGEIWTTDLDGNETPLTDDPHDDLGPAWSPGRARIAFSSNRAAPNVYELYTMDADGTGVEPATAFGNRWVEDAAWSPDGDEIVVTVRLPGMPDRDLYIVDLGQPLGPTNPRQLTQGAPRDVSPSWSPDGMQIAFVRDGDIHVVPADGSAPPTPRITDVSATSVDWSSQGELAFSRYDVAFLGPRIWRADALGANSTRVTDGLLGHSDLTPSWSRDGSRIAFVREDSQVEVRTGVIHVVGSDGSNPQAIPGQQDDNRDPDW